MKYTIITHHAWASGDARTKAAAQSQIIAEIQEKNAARWEGIAPITLADVEFLETTKDTRGYYDALLQIETTVTADSFEAAQEKIENFFDADDSMEFRSIVCLG